MKPRQKVRDHCYSLFVSQLASHVVNERLTLPLVSTDAVSLGCDFL